MATLGVWCAIGIISLATTLVIYIVIKIKEE